MSRLLFRPRGVVNNDSKYATPARSMTMPQMLAYRDTWLEPPCEGFDVFGIIDDSRRDKAEPKATLTKSENGWQPVDKTKLSETAIAVRRVQNSLNKITKVNFNNICREILETPHILHDEAMPRIVSCFFEKALDEPVFAEHYARLCFEIAKFENDTTGSKHSVIRTSILNSAQAVFEKEGVFDDQNSTDDQRIAFRKRKVNNIKFVAELFKNRLLSKNIISHILTTKLMTGVLPSESDAEVSCELLMSIGGHWELELEGGDRTLEPVFQRVNELIKLEKERAYSNRVKFMLMNLLDLRKAGWKRAEKQIEEFHITPAEYSQMKEESGGSGAPGTATSDGRRRMPASGSSANLASSHSPSAGAHHADPTASAHLPGSSSSPQLNSDEAKRDDEVRKNYSLALPPSVDDSIVRKVVAQFTCVLEETAEGAERDAGLAKALNEEVVGVLKSVTARDARTASVCFMLRNACTTSNATDRGSLAGILLNQSLWKDKNEFFRGVSWFLVSAISDRLVEDCPRLYDRLVEFLLSILNSGAATFNELTRDVFARSANYLDAVSQYDPEIYGPEWDVEFTTVWEHLVGKAARESITPVAEILDHFGVTKVSDFLARVIPDVVGTLIGERACTSDDLKAWVAGKEEKMKQGKGDEKLQRLVKEVELLV